MKVGIIGRTKLLYNTVLAVHRAGYSIQYIITSPEESCYSVTSKDFKVLARKIGVPFLCTKTLDALEAVKLMKTHAADVGVSINWKTKISKKVLDRFPVGIINAHMGDLPRYRGNAPANWALLAGENEIALTLHFMNSNIDEGPILLKKKFRIDDHTYIGDIYSLLETEIPKAYCTVFRGLADKSIQPIAQSKDTRKALRCYPRVPADGYIDWNQQSLYISRLIRASAEPFAGAYTYCMGKKLIIWKGYEEHSPTPFLGIPGQVAQIRAKSGEVVVLAKDNFIVLQEVQVEGSKKQKPAEIIKSVRLRLGLTLEQQRTS